MHTSLPCLIIIDMQKGMARPAAGSRNNPDGEAHIAQQHVFAHHAIDTNPYRECQGGHEIPPGIASDAVKWFTGR